MLEKNNDDQAFNAAVLANGDLFRQRLIHLIESGYLDEFIARRAIQKTTSTEERKEN